MNYLATQYTNNDIIWNGPNISCIKVCTGDTVSILVHNICKHICELTETYEDVDLQCLISYCGNCDKDKSLKRILELVLKNDCDLKELIDNLNTDLENALVLKFDLNNSCFTGFECSYEQGVFDECGKLITQDHSKILQYLIDIYCCFFNYLDSINENIFSANQSYNEAKEFIDEKDYYVESLVSSCLTSIPIKYTDLLKVVSDKACDIVENVGVNEVDMMTALGYADGAVNFMYSTLQQWKMLKDLEERLSVVESNTCCTPNCDNIDIAYTSILNTENTFYTLTFNTYTGNNIPSGFIDDGSTITITDDDGVVLILPIVLQNNLTFLIPTTGLNIVENLSISIESKLKKDELYCQKTFNSVITN